MIGGNGSSFDSPSNAFTLLKNGDLTIADTLTQGSDARVKQNVQPLGEVLPKLEAITGVAYQFIDGKGPAGQQVGLLAQEVRQAFPELVHEDSQGELFVAYGNFMAVLLEAVKELKARNDTLQAEEDAEITELQAMVADLAAIVQHLQSATAGIEQYRIASPSARHEPQAALGAFCRVRACQRGRSGMRDAFLRAAP